MGPCTIVLLVCGTVMYSCKGGLAGLLHRVRRIWPLCFVGGDLVLSRPSAHAYNTAQLKGIHPWAQLKLWCESWR